MKKKKYLLLLLGFLFLLSGCKKGEKLALSLDSKISLVDGKLETEFISNLPTGTKAIVSVLNPDENYLAQSYVESVDGLLKPIEEFSKEGGPLAQGVYNISFIMPLSSIQNPDIQNLLGDDYKNIDSDLLIENDYGNTIEFNTTYEIK